jgi:ABC-2 type transport system permease protein
MRSILSIAWNDIRIELQDKSTLIFFLILPLVFTAIIGLTLGNIYGPTEETGDSRLVLSFVDEDQSAQSKDLTALLEKSTTFPLEKTANAEAGFESFTQNNLDGLLTIPAGFGAGLQNGQPAMLSLILPNNADTAISIQENIKSVSRQLEGALKIAQASTDQAIQKQPFASPADQQQYYDDSYALAKNLIGNPPITIQTEVSGSKNSVIPSGFEQSSPGQLVTWVMTTLLGGSVVFVDERIRGTLRRLLITPNRKAAILTGKILGRFTLGIIQMVIMIVFGASVLHVNWGQSVAALALILVAFSLAGTAMGVMLAAFSRTTAQANGFSILFSMILSALGGAWWPLEITPTAYQQAVQVLPTTWAMKGFTDVIVRGQGVSGILPEAGILLAFAALFFIIGVWRLRFE